MYMNLFQLYIKDLIAEYGVLLKRQLLQMICFRFNAKIKNIDKYIFQMCNFADYEITMVGKEEAVGRCGNIPDYDIIRSFDVMLAFIPRIIHHRKSRDYVSIAFAVSGAEHDKEIFIIPVKEGDEKIISNYANDKFTTEKCEVVIFLLEDKKQSTYIYANCDYNFAVISKKGVKFTKPNNPNI